MTQMITPEIMRWLERTANCAVSRALRLGVSSGAREPEFVAAVVIHAIPEIAIHWEPIFDHAGLSATYSAVFCHQSPIATYRDSKCNKLSCELADLLAVVDDTTGGALVRRRAVLVQAKKMPKSQGEKTLTGSSDLTQLGLYSTWPAFELGSGFRSGLRDFSTCRHPGKDVDCGRYGLIGGLTPVWHQQEPAQTMPGGGDELGTFLARMVENRSGYGREATGIADDWSRTVEELRRITFAKIFRFPSTGAIYSRGVSGSIFQAPAGAFGLRIGSQDNEGGGSPGDDNNLFEEQTPNDGISLLHIEVREREEG